MKKRYLAALVTMGVMGMGSVSTAGAASFWATGVNEQAGWWDVNKKWEGSPPTQKQGFFPQPRQDGDHVLSWAATAANILSYTNWSPTAGRTINDTHNYGGENGRYMSYFRDNFRDTTGSMKDGWSWWFSGQTGWLSQTAAPVTRDGGGFYSDAQFNGSWSPWERQVGAYHGSGRYYNQFGYFLGGNVLGDLRTYLGDSGWGVGLGIEGEISCLGPGGQQYSKRIGHAVTVWGFEEEGSNYSIWITDSNDQELALVKYAIDDHGNFLDGIYAGAHIAELQALASNGGVSPNAVPIPGAVWLLGTGLVGLVGMRRRKGEQE